MKRCYVPYSGDSPLVVTINGHDLILVGLDPEVFEESDLLSYESERGIEVREYDLNEMRDSRDGDSQELGSDHQLEVDSEGEPSEQVSLEDRFSERPSFVESLEESMSDRFEAENWEGDIWEEGPQDLEDLELDSDSFNAAELRILGGDDGAPSELPVVEGLPLGDEFTKVLEKFAHTVALESGSGVVFVPSTASLDDVIESLEGQLPWLQ